MYRIQLQHKDFLVINKSPGLGMHDDAGEPGLVNLVRADTGLELYPVHRLDKMTSGLVLLARTPEANRALSMAFAAREVSKQYLALSDRKPKKKQNPLKAADVTVIDYKDVALLRKFISDRGKIRARRVTGVTVQEQRKIAQAIKNAREVALLPYSGAGR